MPGEPQDIFRDERGRYKSGFNTRITKRMRFAARLEELRREYFPAGGESVMDANRLRLAAMHYFTAETSTDALLAQRATRVAEYLLSKLKPPASPRPPGATDFEKEMWEDLQKGDKTKSWTPSSR
jgi:hypothetical protein